MMKFTPFYLLLILWIVTTSFAACDKLVVSYENFDFAQRTGRMVQVQGAVVGDYSFDLDTVEFKFRMKDQNGQEMDVIYAGPKPNGFEHVDQVVVTGTVENERFVASHILTKCPSKYEEDAAAGLPVPQLN